MGSSAPDNRQDDPRGDAELVAAANAGDVAAFEALYRRYREWAVNLAFRFTRDRDLALDVCQETFIYLLGKFPGFELRSRIKTLLYPVVRNLAITNQSRSGRIGPPANPPESAGLAPRPDADEARLQLAEAVEALPPGQREVLLLRFVDGLSLAEISAAMEIPLGTVKSRLHNALEALRSDERTKTYFEP